MTGVWRTVHDEHTLDVCELAEGAASHGIAPDGMESRCRCWREDIASSESMPRHQLLNMIAGQEQMLTHASNTIARLEGRWRAPGVATWGQRVVVIEAINLMQHVANAPKPPNKRWQLLNGELIDILAWHELPAMPSEDGFRELT